MTPAFPNDAPRRAVRRQLPRPALAALVAVVLTVLAVAVPLLTGGSRAAATTAPGLPRVSVKGNTLVTGDGRPLRLLGVDRAGTEYACAQGWGIFEGPTDATAIAAMAGWGANAVRVPLNEDCWLGINGVSASYSGANYRNAIVGYVSRLQAAGLVVVLDLHWNAPGTTKATGQQLMADADHSPAFWRSVAATFVGNPGLAFDLYNEPHGISWSCWRDGCTTSAGWHAAGMQSLVDAVRSTGARQPVLAGGLNWAGDLSQWLTYRPTDSAGQLAASAHIYNFSQCNTSSCWDSSIGKVAASFPVVTGELGEDDCGTGFVTRYMDWADAHGVGYLGWTWNTWGCGSGPALIASWDGTPTAFGVAVRDRLRQLATAPVPAAPVTTAPTTSAPAVTSAPSTPSAPATSAPAPGHLVYG
ncbi:MAG: cellulase family glycosylhydrolase, partial [Actinomycetes bacterium]